MANQNARNSPKYGENGLFQVKNNWRIFAQLESCQIVWGQVTVTIRRRNSSKFREFTFPFKARSLLSSLSFLFPLFEKRNFYFFAFFELEAAYCMWLLSPSTCFFAYCWAAYFFRPKLRKSDDIFCKYSIFFLELPNREGLPFF